jgi:hypothetical protein
LHWQCFASLGQATLKGAEYCLGAETVYFYFMFRSLAQAPFYIAMVVI